MSDIALRLMSAASARRRFLQQLSALGVAAAAADKLAAAGIVNPPALLEIEQGHYKFLPSGQVFCGGVLPLEGYEVIHALLLPGVALTQAYGFVERYLQEQKLPIQALCGMELRVPAQMSFDAFRTFNVPYVEQLSKWDLTVGNYSAVCRTNVASGLDAPALPSLHAFSYVAASTRKGSTFCISGTADIDAKGKIVAAGDLSAEGMKKKLDYVIQIIASRMEELELKLGDANQVDLHAVADLRNLWGTTILPKLGTAAAAGVRYHYTRPPILGAEVELEVRRVAQEIVIQA